MNKRGESITSFELAQIIDNGFIFILSNIIALFPIHFTLRQTKNWKTMVVLQQKLTPMRMMVVLLALAGMICVSEARNYGGTSSGGSMRRR